ncbi:MAG: SDR family oxidoreductase, partial [Chloroflexota bacterium]
LVARDRKQLLDLRQELTPENPNVVVVAGDVRDDETCGRAVATALEAFGRIDILINNAGIAIHKLIVDLTAEDYDAVMDTNMRATFLFARAVIPLFARQQRGTLIIVGSGAAVRGIAGESTYCASKFAQRGFALALDHELRSQNIKVCMVHPGNVDTRFSAYRETPAPEGILKPEDVAQAVLFVALQPEQSRVLELSLRPMEDSI